MPVKNALLTTEKGIRFIEDALVFFCGLVFMALLFLGTADVIGRTVFRHPIIGTYEISEVMMGAIVLLGWAYAQKKGEHVAVDLVYAKFPPLMKTITSIVTTSLTFILFILILFKSWNIALENIDQGRRFIILDFPSGPFYLLVPIGAFFICLELIIQLAHLIPELRKK
jgi:TRAP-type C4-dicarboxylate transport system permease small subunit